MRRLAGIAVFWLAGCQRVLGIGDLRLVDAGPDAPADAVVDAGPDAPPDADLCLGAGLVRVCPPAPAAGAVVLGGTLDTDAACPLVVPQLAGPALCAVVAMTITVNDLRVTGTRPLVLAASDEVRVAGTLDASSRQGQPAGAGAGTGGCPVIDGQDATNGGGGGGGGGFGAAGGVGGAGRAGAGGPRGAAVADLVAVRGGCAGGTGGDGGSSTDGSAGDPGAGGGAVYLLAGARIVVTGEIFASGAGGGGANQLGTGRGGGGGGGGSGGLVGLEAPAIELNGRVAANGGGGGGGGDCCDAFDGQDGTTTSYASAAAGGANEGNGHGGKGGDGGAAATVAGDGKVPGTGGGGGGGGGGVGVVWVKGALSGPNRISPAPTMH